MMGSRDRFRSVILKQVLTLALGILLFTQAQAKPPEERLVLLIGSSPEAQEQAAQFTPTLVGSGPFTALGIESKSGQAFGLSPEASYLIRQVGSQIVWQRSLAKPEQAWQDFQVTSYDVEEDKLLGWVQVLPQETEEPLRRDELVEFYAGGLPGLQVSATLGGKTVPLFEDRPGYYTGAYRVVSEDRVEAKISVEASSEDGLQDSRQVAELAIQGLQPPKLTAMGQVGLREWAFQGKASPGTTVEISIAIRIGSLFGARTKRRTVETVADADGNFEAIASLGTLTSSPKGIVKTKSIDLDGVEMLGPEQEVRFRSRVVRAPYYNNAWGYRRGPWGGGPFFRTRPFPRGCR